MNKYNMTLRQLNHDKPLREYYEVHETKLMLECIRLYNETKLDDYTPSDIMKMVRLNICNDEMVPMAIDILRHNEMIKVEHFSGDLLSAICGVDKSYWMSQEGQRKEIERFLVKAKEVIDRCCGV